MTGPEPVDLRVRAETRLAELGATADAVATSLEGAGHCGRIGRAYCCPVARYLNAVEPSLSAVVSQDEITVYVDGPDGVHLATPPAVRAFVGIFDQGGYPNLVDRRTDVDDW